MITLQRFITPDQEICTEHALYYQAHGAIGFSSSTGEYLLPSGSRLSLESYFNLFNLEKWGKTCALDGLFAELQGAGQMEIRVTRAFEARSWEVIYSEVVTLDPASPHVIDLSAYASDTAEGVVFVSLLSLGEEVRFMGGRFATASVPEILPDLTISITTFKREQEVRRTVERLEDFLDSFAYAQNIRVQVVDNGQSAEIAASDHVTPLPNRNLGGAGGFARGLLEAQNAGASHVLFMDDDASFHMENIARTFMFLALARDPKTALAGAMINNTHKWAMWENGAWFDGSCHPLHNGTDLRNPGAVVRMEFLSARENHATLYGGWWFFAFPVAQVSHHPFPFFVRGDDISFSLANDFKIYTLNGVVSFQDDFTEKESGQTLYLDLRNHLLHHLIFDKLERSAFGTARVAIRFMMRSLLRCHYSSAEAQLLAWQDVMQGPEFFDRNIDMSQRRSDIKEITADEAWQPIDTVDQRETRGPIARWPRRLRHYFGLLTLNGHLIPLWSRLGGHLVLPIADRSLVYPSFGGTRLTFLNTNRDKGYTVTHSKRRFFGLAWKMTQTLWAFSKDYDALKASYRAGYDEMTTEAYWQKTLHGAAPDDKS